VNNLYIKQHMIYGDHNFIEITQQTKLRVALVVSRSMCRPSWAVLFDNVDTAKKHGLDTSNVSSGKQMIHAKYDSRTCEKHP